MKKLKPQTMHSIVEALNLWCDHCKDCLGDNFSYEFAMEQWLLYWDGVRDARLHDCAIWLIDRYGYRN